MSQIQTALGILSTFVAMKVESKLHSTFFTPVGGPVKPTFSIELC
jgi:hypothetical protein